MYCSKVYKHAENHNNSKHHMSVIIDSMKGFALYKCKVISITNADLCYIRKL